MRKTGHKRPLFVPKQQKTRPKSAGSGCWQLACGSRLGRLAHFFFLELVVLERLVVGHIIGHFVVGVVIGVLVPLPVLIGLVLVLRVCLAEFFFIVAVR